MLSIEAGGDLNVLLKIKMIRRFKGGSSIAFNTAIRLESNPVVVLLGPSGCGKTTVLRCLAGLDTPNEGIIRFRDNIWFDSVGHVHMAPQARRVGYVAQDSALFPHLTVLENIQFGILKLSKSEREIRVAQSIDLFGITPFLNRLPSQISGGQKQKVALARSLVTRPRLLLLDEPFSALDSWTRKAFRPLLKGVLKELNVPSIWVTHDEDEADQVSDEMINFGNGY